MSSYEKILESGVRYLEEQHITEARLDAWYLLEYLLGCDRAWYYLHMREEAPEELQGQYKELLVQRGKHKPLQQITGSAYFMGLEFYVSDQVLIPRQDTEILVEEALKRMKPGAKILDLCTGTACILLSLLYNGNRSVGTGSDISEEALAIARKNARHLGIEAELLQSDLFEKIEGTYDVIVSNPPYIPTDVIGGLMEEVRDFEPHLALDGGADGLAFYRKIIREADAYLKHPGWLLFEIGAEQGEAVAELMRKAGYEEVQVIPDLAGLDRVAAGKKEQEDVHV